MHGVVLAAPDLEDDAPPMEARTIRMPNDLWEDIGHIAKVTGRTGRQKSSHSRAIVKLLRWAVAEWKAENQPRGKR